uniref:Nucleosome assembly protein n=1 Tax=Noctiluca scintillans TaxID=2966 RepID=A0A7S1AI30_NOCSC|mmetsp:Transcript_45671/g.121128  ORF Transcript_45671/g.121128 Transcript_45671/m.121128 type:complete len:305 (+) Transcript_45671:56-970(+)
MGVKKQDTTGEEVPKVEAEIPEDPPLIKELKVLDDKYLEQERAHQKELQALERKFTERQQPLLDERTKLLSTGAGEGGTPALTGFWLQALKNHPSLEDAIEAWDEPVLKHLTDITTENVDSDADQGFRLTFHFAENPYISNATLWKEYRTQEESPYSKETEVKSVKVSDIEWKDGQDVTVTRVTPKVKGGGAKKQKQKAKEKFEARDSFFRHIFRNMEQGMTVPDDVNVEMEDSDDENEAEIVEMMMSHDIEVGEAIRDQIIPFAVRWYTGEASPEEDDDDDDDDDDHDCCQQYSWWNQHDNSG